MGPRSAPAVVGGRCFVFVGLFGGQVEQVLFCCCMFTSLKSNMDTNNRPFLKEVTFSKASFIGTWLLDFGGVTVSHRFQKGMSLGYLLYRAGARVSPLAFFL